jgi:hypothetical protein
MAVLKNISHEVLRNRLREGAVTFSFRKTDGSLRRALGTLESSRIPESGKPKGGTPPPGVTTFFDLEKSAWRSVSYTQEIWVD